MGTLTYTVARLADGSLAQIDASGSVVRVVDGAALVAVLAPEAFAALRVSSLAEQAQKRAAHASALAACETIVWDRSVPFVAAPTLRAAVRVARLRAMEG